MSHEFYEKLVEDDVMSKASKITSVRFEQRYEEMLKEVDHVMVITLSSKLSGTYYSAVISVRNFNNKVFVVDSMNVATGERLLCQYAIKLIEQGLQTEKIVKKLKKRSIK